MNNNHCKSSQITSAQLKEMRLLTYLSLQALFIALLCSSAFAESGVPTLDGLIKFLGSLYQHKLYPLRDDGEDFGPVPSEFQTGGPILPELRETVTFPRQHKCMASIPYCVSFYATMIIQDAPIHPERQNIRNDDTKRCFTDIALGPCPERLGLDDSQEIMDFSKLQINDFCVPGTIELNGTVDILNDITQSSAMYVEFKRRPGTSYKRRSDRPSPAPPCLNGGEYCVIDNMCDWIERDGCKARRNFYDDQPFPCFCPVNTGMYDMSSFKREINSTDYFNTGRNEGFVIISTKKARTCFSFSFTGVLAPL